MEALNINIMKTTLALVCRGGGGVVVAETVVVELMIVVITIMNYRI